MANEQAEVQITIEGGDMDADELDKLARQLLHELRQLDADVAPAAAAPAPPGSKGIDPAFLQALTVQMAAGLMAQLVNCVNGWLARRGGETVRIKYSVAGRELEIEHRQDLPPEQLQALIRTVMQAVATAGEPPAVA